MSILSYDFMVRALVAALLVGVTAPAVGIYLVQRRMSLIGDGIGHIALTGVALGFLLNQAPVLTAIIVAALGAVVIELIRERGRTSGDVALAMMFYGGIAGGVLLIGLAPASSNTTLLSYLFGSLLTTSAEELVVVALLAGAVLAVTTLLRPWLFAVCHDEEYARVSGLPVRLLNLLLAVTAAVTVTVAMRVVGLLLVSAMMVVPVATAQQLARSFLGTAVAACGIGVIVSVSGAIGSYYLDVAPGANIVILALAVFIAVSVVAALGRRWRGALPSSEPPATPEAAPHDVVLER
jgi:zinc transport system permease protein